MKDTRSRFLIHLAAGGMNIPVSRFMDELRKKNGSTTWHLHYGEDNIAFFEAGIFHKVLSVLAS